jgi:hypothetical protein
LLETRSEIPSRPKINESKTLTLYFDDTSFLVRTLPIYPAPPVTSILENLLIPE